MEVVGFNPAKSMWQTEITYHVMAIHYSQINTQSKYKYQICIYNIGIKTWYLYLGGTRTRDLMIQERFVPRRHLVKDQHILYSDCSFIFMNVSLRPMSTGPTTHKIPFKLIFTSDFQGSHSFFVEISMDSTLIDPR
jgi:hypothetical protein